MKPKKRKESRVFSSLSEKNKNRWKEKVNSKLMSDKWLEQWRKMASNQLGWSLVSASTTKKRLTNFISLNHCLLSERIYFSAIKRAGWACLILSLGFLLLSVALPHIATTVDNKGFSDKIKCIARTTKDGIACCKQIIPKSRPTTTKYSNLANNIRTVQRR